MICMHVCMTIAYIVEDTIPNIHTENREMICTIQCDVYMLMVLC